MSLAPGYRLGPYDITAQIGAGGMGVVYRARDTKLGRDVAIKVLPDAFAADADRLARFEREARALAGLNHPHIATLYGIEESGGVRALVMELVEGDTLAERIATGALPVDDALRVARQIAEALQAAHDQGIVHRDLKPANVKLRPDGVVKVLDFGLAKALEASPAGDASASPTISFAATQAGVILGTAAYMAPEQAKGKPADRRSDLWAFGCVLYEMLTGKPTFQGDDVTETLAAALMREPDWTALPPNVPAAIRTLLRRCLDKEPRRRISDVAVALFALDEGEEFADVRGLAVLDSARAREAGHDVRRRARVALVGATAAVIGSIATGAAVWWATRPAPPGVVRTEVTTGGATALSILSTDRDVAITPDGSRLIYRGDGQILVRALDQLEPNRLSGLGSPRGPFVSPDGQWVGFFDGVTTLKKVAITGGPPVTIASVDGSSSLGATWGVDGTIVFATIAPTGLQRVSANGGEVTVLTTPNREAGEADHRWPEFLPGRHAILFTIAVSGGLDNAQIAVLDLASGTYKVLVRGGHHAHYVPSGHLVYGSGSTLRAVAFDPERLEVVGAPVPVLEGVMATPLGAVNVAFATSGTVVYVPGSGVAGTMRSLVWVDRTGREEPLRAPPRAYIYPRISPDGRRLGLQILDQENDIWIWDFARETLTRLTFDQGLDRYSVWTPDGQRIVFASEMGGGTSNLFWQASDGTGPAEQLTEGPIPQFPMSVSPDGTRLLFYEIGPKTTNDLMVLPLQGERRAGPLIQTPFSELNAEVSPDGRWVAYQSNESGQDQIYVRPFPDVSRGRWQVSTSGGTRPLWARSGEELFYLSPAGALMRVPIERGPDFVFGTATMLLEGKQYFLGTATGLGGTGRVYDISPDGRRFLMIKENAGDQGPPQNLVVVQHWAEELKRLVPTN